MSPPPPLWAKIVCTVIMIGHIVALYRIFWKEKT